MRLHYLVKPKIVFCENSNAGKSEIQQILLIYHNCCQVYQNIHFRS